MRIRSLRLEKFGHFEDDQVDFGPGLTVVYGPNEAGKSTLLDGLSGFLWGVYNKNPRAFKYASARALLTGSVESGDIAVTLVRRLRKLTCDAVEQDALWGPSTSDSDAEWRRTFGMDRAGLREGGRQIVSGRGDLADVIAMAETGEAISRLLAHLEERAEVLFKERKNASCEIRDANDTINQLNKQISECEASAADVAALETRIGDLGARKADLHDALNQARREQRRLEELQRCFGPAAALREARQTLQRTLAEGIVVDRVATERLGRAIEDAARAIEGAAHVGTRIAAAQQRRDGHAFSPAILDAASDIDGLREQLQARKADRRIVDDTDEAARLERAVEEVLRKLGSPETSDPLAAARALLLGEQVREQLSRYARDVADAQRVANDKRKAVARLQREAREADAADRDEEGERDVVLARQRRDDAWQHLRAPWLSGDLPESAQRQSMARALDDGIANADDVAQTRSDALQALARRKGEVGERARQLRQAQHDRDEAQAALSEQSRRWAELVARHALPGGLDPTAWEVHARLLGELTQAVEGVRANADSREQAQRRLAAFAQDTARLSGLVPAANTDPFAVVGRLTDALDKSRAAQEAVGEIDLLIAADREKLEDCSRRRAEAEQVIARLMDGIDEPVETVLERSVRRHAAHDEVAGAEQVLRQAKNPESDLQALAEAAAVVDRVTLDSDADEIKRRVEECEAAHHELSEKLGAAQSDLARLTSRDSVAHLLAERVEHASHVQALVEEYQSLRVQIELLKRYKQWLADTSDSTVLDHAGELLEVLTAGRFDGFAVVEEEGARRIDVRYNDPATRGEPTTMALGGLSEGTADQVFLALRLAGIAVRQRQRMKSGLAMVPVVLDDVLMSHDDDRAAAALRAMAGLSDQMQIILLTHHRSVADAAAEIDGVQVTELKAAVQAG